MSEIKHNKSTDSENEIKLDSSLIYAVWRSGSAYAGNKAEFEIGTSFVGNGASIKITGKSAKGKKLGKVSGKINNNIFIDKFDLPDDLEPGDTISFEVELKKNSLSGKSNEIPVFPKPGITNMKWSADEARRGETLTLTADVERVTGGSEAKIIIMEYDSDGAHDKITEIPALVKNKKIEIMWEYEYHEDSDEIPSQEELDRYGASYNPPEYFFVININGYEFGLEQESGILGFKDYIEIDLVDEYGNKSAKEKYKLTLPDGSTKEGNLDDDGYAKIENIPPGKVTIEFPDIPEISLADDAGE